MSEGNDSNELDFVEANINPANLDLYVVTEDKLNNISTSSIGNDILALLASLSWGAYFSAKIAINTSEKLSEANLATIMTYQSFFFWTGILLFIAFLGMKYSLFTQIKGITTIDAEIDTDRMSSSGLEDEESVARVESKN